VGLCGGITAKISAAEGTQAQADFVRLTDCKPLARHLLQMRGWQDSHLDGRRQGGGTINALLSLLEIAFSCLVDIKELLWIEVDDREPAALDLNHNAMPSAKGVKRV
jgi:hypothetical protein